VKPSDDTVFQTETVTAILANRPGRSPKVDDVDDFLFDSIPFPLSKVRLELCVSQHPAA